MSNKLEPGEIEVFRAGDYPQAKYTEADVAAIAASYDPENSHRAYLKAGHKDGGMAYGIFDRLRAVGDTLIARLSAATPQVVKDAFSLGQVSGWSSEIYPNLNGKGPYLKAVALLGATPPAVKGLKASLDFEHQVEADVVQYFAVVPEHTTNAESPTAPTKEKQMAENKPAGSETPKGDEKPTVDAQKFAELQAENAALKLEQAANAERIHAIEVSGLRATIHSFAEAQKRDGKLNVGDVDAGVEAFMEAIDGVTFKVGDKAHEARHFFMEMVERRITPVPMGVGSGASASSPGGSKVYAGAGAPVDATSVSFHEQTEAYAAEHKISYGEAFKALRTTNNPYRTAGV